MALPEGATLPDKAKVLSEGIFNGNSTPTQQINVPYSLHCIEIDNVREDEHNRTDVFFHEVEKNIFYFAVYQYPKEVRGRPATHPGIGRMVDEAKEEKS